MVYQSRKRAIGSVWCGGVEMNAKDETGKRYGPYIVLQRVKPNYPNNGTVKWLCKCIHCGAKKIYIRNLLRFNKYRHTCDECGGR